MKSYIIGIAGTKNAGKDTVASMINYIFAVGITKANFGDWVIHKSQLNFNYKSRIIHFADGLKDVLSIIYNIPRIYFDDRTIKDNTYYNIKAHTFISKHEIDFERPCNISVDIEDLQEHTLNEILNNNKAIQVYIKLRTLMQYFGTNICRNQLADDIWIRHTITKAVDIANSKKLCLIPDVRFANEAKAIKKQSASLYGGLIEVRRGNNDSYEHESENIDFNCDFVIDNNSTKTMLFYKVLEICNTIKL